MTAQQAERTVVVTMRLLVIGFAATGVLFVSTPDGVIGALDDVGAKIGDFSPGADTDQRLWLGLAFAYMVLVTGIALLVQSDVARFRPLLLLLAAGKAASSLTAGAFFVLHDDAFAYLANLVVDGGLVAVALGCWAIAGRVERPRAESAVERPPAAAGVEAPRTEPGQGRTGSAASRPALGEDRSAPEAPARRR